MSRVSESSLRGWPEHDPRDWRRLAQQAADALTDFWMPDLRFSVTTVDGSESLGVSSTATEALVSLHDAFPNWQSRAKDIVGTCARVITEQACPAFAFEGGAQESMTEALDVAAFASAIGRVFLMDLSNLTPAQRGALGDDYGEVARALIREQVAPGLIRAVDFGGDGFAAGAETGLPLVHSYIPYRLMRAISIVSRCLVSVDKQSTVEAELLLELAAKKEGLAVVLRERSRTLVASHRLKVVNQYEAIALCFCGAGLVIAAQEAAQAGAGPLPDHHVIEIALRSSLSAQGADGRWPLTRLWAGSNRVQVLEISGFEVASCLADTLLELYALDELTAEAVATDVVPAIVAAARHTERMRLEVEAAGKARMGWSAELSYGEISLETVATADVLQQTVSLARLAGEADSREALRSFAVLDTVNDYWPDWIQWDNYRAENEPDSRARILDWLDRTLVKPRLRHGDPLWARRRAQIVLMFGPPGTTKTTIVRSVAVGLRWPLVTLSPGDFIRDGLDLIEAQAANIFDRLHRLTRAVVLFDECDELFADRGRPEDHEEEVATTDEGDDRPKAKQQSSMVRDRGISAFVTASMLPKLQDLHDRSQVLVFVLTNFYERLDPAIVRLGRVDHVVGVGTPDPTQRKLTIERQLQGDQSIGDQAGVAAGALAVATALYNRPELLEAAKILRARLVALRREGIDLNELNLEQAVLEVQSKMTRITVSQHAEDRFKELAFRVSDPHMEAGEP